MNKIYHKLGGVARLITLTACCIHSASSQAAELFEEDSMGNVNQRNVGSFKSNRQGGLPVAGTVIKRNRPLQPYATLKLEIPAELTYYETGNARVEIEAASDELDKINFVYNGNRLTIKSSGFSITAPIKLTLYGNDLQRVFINTAAEATLNDISVNEFYLSVRGAADVSVEGQATGCRISAQGASDLDLSKLRCQSATLAVQGSPDIVLSASKSIKGRVQGAGDIEVLGNPRVRKLEVTGAYDIDYR